MNENKAELDNFYLPYVEPTEKVSYYQIQDIVKFLNLNAANDEAFVEFWIQPAATQEFITRGVFTITGVLTSTGGIYNSMFTIGFLFNAAFSYRLLMSSLIRKLFHFEAKNKEERYRY